jgi:hypothetical protein
MPEYHVLKQDLMFAGIFPEVRKLLDVAPGTEGAAISAMQNQTSDFGAGGNLDQDAIERAQRRLGHKIDRPLLIATAIMPLNATERAAGNPPDVTLLAPPVVMT